MTEPSNLRDAADVEPLCPFTDRPAWECAAACTCAHFKPTGIIKHAHPPAAPTDALVEWCSQDLPCARYQALEAEVERLRKVLEHNQQIHTGAKQ